MELNSVFNKGILYIRAKNWTIKLFFYIPYILDPSLHSSTFVWYFNKKICPHSLLKDNNLWEKIFNWIAWHDITRKDKQAL